MSNIKNSIINTAKTGEQLSIYFSNMFSQVSTVQLYIWIKAIHASQTILMKNKEQHCFGVIQGHRGACFNTVGIQPTTKYNERLTESVYSRLAHSLMALRVSLKFSMLGTRCRISSVTLQPNQ